MPSYEMILILKPGINRTMASKVLYDIGKEVLSQKGVILELTSFGQKSLCYDIRKQSEKFDEGEFFKIRFSSNPLVVKTLEPRLNIQDSVLRWGVLKQKLDFSDHLKKMWVAVTDGKKRATANASRFE